MPPLSPTVLRTDAAVCALRCQSRAAAASRTRAIEQDWLGGKAGRFNATFQFMNRLQALKSAVQNAKLGREEELDTLKRLDDQARRLERTASGPSFQEFVEGKLQASPSLGGRSVFGWEEERSDPRAATK